MVFAGFLGLQNVLSRVADWLEPLARRRLSVVFLALFGPCSHPQLLEPLHGGSVGGGGLVETCWVDLRPELPSSMDGSVPYQRRGSAPVLSRIVRWMSCFGACGRDVDWCIRELDETRREPFGARLLRLGCHSMASPAPSPTYPYLTGLLPPARVWRNSF